MVVGFEVIPQVRNFPKVVNFREVGVNAKLNFVQRPYLPLQTIKLSNHQITQPSNYF